MRHLLICSFSQAILIIECQLPARCGGRYWGNNREPNQAPLSFCVDDKRDINQLITQINIKLLSPPRRGTWDYVNL